MQSSIIARRPEPTYGTVTEREKAALGNFVAVGGKV
jgi:hypothetical protein